MTDISRNTLSPNGARERSNSWFTRMLARAVARNIRVFVVPGGEIARSFGLDVEGLGLTLADTPRHASVLMTVGRLTPELERAAAVAYAQIPRPRAILAIGGRNLHQLKPDVVAELEPDSVAAGIEEIRTLFAQGAFQSAVSDFEVDGIETRVTYTCAMHPEVVRDKPGSCPICGMELLQRESGADEEKHNMHESEDSHGGMDHNHMDHGGMDFMSMVEMTKDLPRSRDGLPMEWIKAEFGPLFPGLPGGLSLTLTLDGDAVVEARGRSLAGIRSEDLQTMPLNAFLNKSGRLDPLSSSAYLMLAVNAIEDASDTKPGDEDRIERIAVLERERISSHLGWLSNLGRLLGYESLRRRTNALQYDFVRGREVGRNSKLEAEVRGLIRAIQRSPFLSHRLRGVGKLSPDERMSGPVARASGLVRDARMGDVAYAALGFEPSFFEGGDSLSRLRVRLAELESSLDLLVSLPRTLTLRETKLYGGAFSGEGNAEIETPRGTARLRLKVEDSFVDVLALDMPSEANLTLVEGLADDTELSEFLVSVNSLDISPWSTRSS
ncbi:Ni,Fe-hydrogenase III large subunit [Rubrobacter radiotolerans DSM 5868]|nr:Ni,Fe-hydrogenase III large subunit [Rubrobacter radiotolerans DSM 5868]